MSKRTAMATLCSSVLLPLFACAAPAAQLKPASLRPVAPDAQPVVVDTDMAADDWLAILYLLSRPDIDVKAITVTGTGEAHCRAGVRNALNLAALAGRPEIPVACGRESPLVGDHTFPSHWRERVDALFGLSIPENPNNPSSESAVELLVRVIQGSPRKVHLITLGPLTNIAEALQAEPVLIDNLQMITIMGGAVHVPGNVGSSSDIDNNAAEWNIYVDPHAAAIVLSSGAPATLVPLDATNYAPLTMDFCKRLEKDRTTSVADFAYRVLSENEDFILSGAYYLWDQLTVAVATDESLATFQELALTVMEEEGPESGRTLTGDEGYPIRVTLTADRSRFETLFLDTLNGRLP